MHKKQNRKNMARRSLSWVRRLFFILAGCYCFYKEYFNSLIILWGWFFLYEIMCWTEKCVSEKKVFSDDRNKEFAKIFRGHVYKPFINDKLEISLDEVYKLTIIGYISGCEQGTFDYIGALVKNKKVIPFRLQMPLKITSFDSIPVVAICVSDIGFDLLKLARNRDWSPFYNIKAFANNDFHGYEFESLTEYNDSKNKILEGTKDLFLCRVIEKKTIAYCIEVCHFGKEWPYEYTSNNHAFTGNTSRSSEQVYKQSDYRSIFLLCDRINDIVEDSGLVSMIRKYLLKRRRKQLYQGKLTSKRVLSGKAGELFRNSIKSSDEYSERIENDVKDWSKSNKIKDLSKAELLEEYQKWMKEGKPVLFQEGALRAIYSSNRKVIQEIIDMKNDLILKANKQAELLEKKL